MWICPACDQPLELKQNTWRCENGHSYDKGKEGYVNLLLAQHKNSKEPGDNKEMVNARRQFLQQGHYQPLVERLYELIVEASCEAKITLFDAGCGEGYYLGFLQNALMNAGLDVEAKGCDISKIAIQKAAKKYKDCHFSVASTFNLPVSDTSQSAVIQVFAPSDAAEVARILKSDGIWIQVDPASEHLHQLKSRIYQSSQKHQNKAECIEGFESLYSQELTFNITLADPEQRLSLLKMTPFFWSASEQSVRELQDSLDHVSCHFHLRLFRKSKEQHHG